MSELVERGARPILGYCPNCGESIPTGGLLIEYETSLGWPQVFAECRNCEDVVHPR